MVFNLSKSVSLSRGLCRGFAARWVAVENRQPAPPSAAIVSPFPGNIPMFGLLVAAPYPPSRR
jgi:hypothetical protein